MIIKLVEFILSRVWGVSIRRSLDWMIVFIALIRSTRIYK
jgi:hypothetical protein